MQTKQQFVSKINCIMQTENGNRNLSKKINCIMQNENSNRNLPKT